MLRIAESHLGRDRVLNRLNGSQQEEQLSDFFAVNLLMPRKEFKKAAIGLAPSMKSLIALSDIFRTSLEAAARRIVDLDVWSCLFLWCAPEKLYGGGFAVKIARCANSLSLVGRPPISPTGYIWWGVDAVCEAYDNKTPSSSTITFCQLGQQVHWSLECMFRGVERSHSILALMLPRS